MCKRLMLIGLALVTVLGFVQTASADLVGWWSFDEGAGNVAKDGSGNGYDGTIIDATWADGQLGSALEFNGSSAYVDIPPESWSTIDTQATCAVWMYIDSAITQSPFTFAAFQDPAANVERVFSTHVAWGGNKTIYFDTGHTGGAYDRINKDATPAEYGDAWVHWAFVKNGDTGDQQIYLNGVLWHSGTGATRSMTGVTKFTLGTKPILSNWWTGMMDDFQLYDHALTVEEIQQAMLGITKGIATSPTPVDTAVDVLRDVTLAWEPGETAATHNVYLGTVADDVNNADATNPLNVLVSPNQGATSYDAGILEFGQTYFWRIDEVNSAPDRTVFKGDLWSFTVEPLAIPVENVTATASGANPNMGPENTVNGSGLNELDQHSNDGLSMWLAAGTNPWIQFELDKPYKLHEMLVWNSNQIVEAFIGFGVKEATIETSLDGESWTAVNGVTPLAQAPGNAAYEANSAVSLGGVTAKFIKLSVVSVHGIGGQSGLSEVRILALPVTAREPQPVNGSTTDSVEVQLSWRAGREAVTHEVRLGPDADNLELIATTDEATVLTDALDYNASYAWSVTEVNDAEVPVAHAGDVWTFNTPEYAIVDDFESYSGDEGEEIYLTWADGFGGDASLGGSTTGHINGPFVETANVNGGKQSMPVYIDNDGGFFDIDGKSSSPNFSEVVRDLDSQDWTAGGIKTLSIMFAGSAGLTGQLYCKIGDTKVIYDGDAANIGSSAWQAWNINLADVGGNLNNVREIAVGVEGGTSGILYIDDIRLYTRPGELLTPVEPDTANLVAYYPLDGDYQDASSNNRHGTAVGGPLFVPGAAGQALELDGGDDYVNIDGYKGINADHTDPDNPVQQPFTISNWVKTTNDSGNTEMVTWGLQGSGTRLTWRIHEGRLRTEHNAGNLRGNTYVNDGEWHHVALVVNEGANLRPETTQLYVDGLEDSYFSGGDTTFKLTADSDVRIGMSGPHEAAGVADVRYFLGTLDEIRIYDRALSAPEIAGLAGKTKPIHIPF